MMVFKGFSKVLNFFSWSVLNLEDQNDGAAKDGLEKNGLENATLTCG